MKIATAASVANNTGQATEECWTALMAQIDGPPSLVLAYFTETHDAQSLVDALGKKVHSTIIQGSSSCQGVMSGQGMHSNSGVGLGLWAIHDPDGDYGVGAASMGADPRAASIQAIEQALERARRPGEVPALVWVNAAPGAEELLLEGIADVVGPDVPVAGGSSGDNAVTGNWSQIAAGVAYTDAVTISVFYPSTEISFAFHSGYEPTEQTGIVTRAHGRVLEEIDGQPAARVYNEWTEGSVVDALDGGGNVLALTTLHPLGREVGRVGAIPYYKLSHLDSVTADGGTSLFSNIEAGEKITLMTGSRSTLIERAGRVAKSALKTKEQSPDTLAGALVIYCAGCMLTVQDAMDQVSDGLNHSLSGAPYLGVFTFGEQGCFLGGENRHGNLMISIVTFARERRQV